MAQIPKKQTIMVKLLLLVEQLEVGFEIDYKSTPRAIINTLRAEKILPEKNPESTDGIKYVIIHQSTHKELPLDRSFSDLRIQEGDALIVVPTMVIG